MALIAILPKWTSSEGAGLSLFQKKKKKSLNHKANANLKVNGKVYPSDKSEKIMQWRFKIYGILQCFNLSSFATEWLCIKTA